MKHKSQPVMDSTAEKATIKVSDTFQLAMLQLARISPVKEEVVTGRYYAYFPRPEAVKALLDLEGSALQHYVGAIQAVYARMRQLKKAQDAI